MKEQNTRSQHPVKCLPPVPSNSDDTDDVDADTLVDEQVLTPSPPKKFYIAMRSEPSVHGVFKTESHTIKKSTSTRKYRCRMCKEGVDRAKDLLQHHQMKHGIVYCKICQKAFNSPLSLARHAYEHKTKSHNCEESFPFTNQQCNTPGKG